MDTYAKSYCSSCKKRYYVGLGDLSDMTAIDVEGGICPYCNNKDLFDINDTLHDEEYEPYYKIGVKQLL